jgi:nucleoside-diphosphate-sugar epimerase
MDFGTDRILVTGALGWLGRGLLHALSHGLPEVERLRSPPPDLRIRALILPGQDAAELLNMSPRIEVVTGDITRREDCDRLCAGAGGAILFHTAGIIHPRRVRELYSVNVEGTKRLLDAAIAAGVRRAVVVSSNSPCGCNPHPDHLFDEESPYHPYMHYGRSKMLMELAVKERQTSGKIETVIIRAPWFYGPFQPPRQTLFFEMIRDGKAPIVGDGNNLRSMAYIDNLAQGLILAAMTPQANGQVYWIADERPYSMNEIVDTVEQLLEEEFHVPCAHKRIRLPHFVSGLARVTDRCLQAIGVYHQKVHVLSEMNKTIACSIRLAQSELGYAPDIALVEGMRRSLRSGLGAVEVVR